MLVITYRWKEDFLFGNENANTSESAGIVLYLELASGYTGVQFIIPCFLVVILPMPLCVYVFYISP